MHYSPRRVQYQYEFQKAKANLYNEPLMIEYKELELKIQGIINNDVNDLKSTISNKFNLNKLI